MKIQPIQQQHNYKLYGGGKMNFKGLFEQGSRGYLRDMMKDASIDVVRDFENVVKTMKKVNDGSVFAIRKQIKASEGSRYSDNLPYYMVLCQIKDGNFKELLWVDSSKTKRYNMLYPIYDCLRSVYAEFMPDDEEEQKETIISNIESSYLSYDTFRNNIPLKINIKKAHHEEIYPSDYET